MGRLPIRMVLDFGYPDPRIDRRDHHLDDPHHDRGWRCYFHRNSHGGNLRIHHGFNHGIYRLLRDFQ